MKKYVVCGVSNRAIGMYIKPILFEFSDVASLVGMLDKDPLRFQVCEENYSQCKDIPRFSDAEFDRMIDRTRPDAVIVTGADHSHAAYILAALRRDLDVVCEKPMTTTAADAQKVLDAEKRSKGKVTVTFNYRYPAVHQKVKELVLGGRIGRVTSADLNWYLDSYHGASYFSRWNRMRESSGGLSIHKCSHHFDLLNWWLGQDPVEVFAYGALNYYGPNGEANPRKVEGRTCPTCPDRQRCAYYTRWKPRHAAAAAPLPKDDHLGVVKPAGRKPDIYTNYCPFMCVFDSEINVEDTYTATIKYSQGALVSYSANFSLPYEGYRLAINGTKGRIETQEFHSPSRVPYPTPEQTIDYLPLFGGAKETICTLSHEGGHGGGDPVILEDIFLGPNPARPYEILAGARAGALAVSIGEAVWRSCKAGGPVRIDQILPAARSGRKPARRREKAPGCARLRTVSLAARTR